MVFMGGKLRLPGRKGFSIPDRSSPIRRSSAYVALGGPNQVASASASPGSVWPPTQAT
jgi:hypothetical protein